jgi:3-methyladenine DNA glycosylase AlkD
MKSKGKSVNAFSVEIQTRVNALPELRTEAIRNIRREFSKLLKNAHPDFVFKLALNLLRFGSVFRFIAYELIQHHPAAMAALDAQLIEKLGQGINSWSTVDCFSCYLAGPAWREGQIDTRVVHAWTRHDDRWWRRAALVATVPLNNKARGGKGDAKRTLQTCALLLDDRDDMIVKAMSWALRELAKRDPSAVSSFLQNECKRLAPRVIREVENKLRTGLKNPKLHE